MPFDRPVDVGGETVASPLELELHIWELSESVRSVGHAARIAISVIHFLSPYVMNLLE
jgi:hypothetical protein